MSGHRPEEREEFWEHAASAPIVRGMWSGGTMLAAGVAALAAGTCWIAAAPARSGSLQFVAGALIWTEGFRRLAVWFHHLRGRWRIEWRGERIRILDRSAAVFTGAIEGLHAVTQDARGHFLFPTRNAVFRLRRGHGGIDRILDQHCRSSAGG